MVYMQILSVVCKFFFSKCKRLSRTASFKVSKTPIWRDEWMATVRLNNLESLFYSSSFLNKKIEYWIVIIGLKGNYVECIFELLF